MKEKAGDKTALFIGVIVLLVVISTAGLYVFSAGFEPGSISVAVIMLIIAGLAAFVLVGRARSIRRGLPAQDEFTKRTMQRAGYYTWLVTIYLTLAVSYLSDEYGIIGRHVGYSIIIGSSIMFFVFYLWFNRKGDV